MSVWIHPGQQVQTWTLRFSTSCLAPKIRVKMWTKSFEMWQSWLVQPCWVYVLSETPCPYSLAILTSSSLVSSGLLSLCLSLSLVIPLKATGPSPEPRVMILPLSATRGRTFWVSSMVPKTLVSKVYLKASGLKASFLGQTPALLMKASTCLYFCERVATKESMLFESAISSFSTLMCAQGFCLRIFPLDSSPRARSLTAIIRCQPCLAASF